jgi:hypothetical protein
MQYLLLAQLVLQIIQGIEQFVPGGKQGPKKKEIATPVLTGLFTAIGAPVQPELISSLIDGFVGFAKLAKLL